MRLFKARQLVVTVCSTVALLAGTPVVAIDNPDAPDNLGVFKVQVRQYEDDLSVAAGNNRKLLEVGGQYRKFLDVELNKAYQSILSKVDDKNKAGLEASQKAWIQYRDAEFAFIAANWTPDEFGSSALLSKNQYATKITRDRIEVLLNYLKNY